MEILGLFLFMSVIVIGVMGLEVAKLKYGETRRQDKLELRLDEIDKKLRNASSDQLDTMKQDINAIKLRMGFQ